MIYRLSDLKRYNNVGRIKSESLAEHQYYCSIIMMKFKKYVFDISDEDYCLLIQYLLIHDIGELYTGDIPHNVKSENPRLKEMIEEIENDHIRESGFSDIISLMDGKNVLKKIFKLCDTMQVAQYCRNEISLGNRNDDIMEIFKNTLVIIKAQVDELKSMRCIDYGFDFLKFLDEIC